MIPYGRQDISAADIAAVTAVLRSDYLTQGPVIPAFETALAEAVGAHHAVAVNSATSALHIACLAAGLGPGDRLWTSPNTFVASANCGLYCGADVDFVDIDLATFNMSTEALRVKLEDAEISGTLPKVVIPVHFGGEPCNMAAIGALAQRYGFTVIEDASHAIGGHYADRPIGACEHSAMSVFSFHPVKIVTTGEGGAVTTNDPCLAETLKDLRSHGITRRPERLSQAPDGPWVYEQHALGLNYRMTDIHAALGTSQLTRLEDMHLKRHALAARYSKLLKGLPVTPQQRDMAHRSGLHLYVITLDNGIDRARVFKTMRASGVGVNVHYIPVHTQPFYTQRGFRAGDFPAAEAYYRQALTLPLFPTLAPAQQDQVVSALEEAIGG